MNEPKNRSFYDITIQTIKMLDEKQLIEMFHDINNIDTVERIIDCALDFMNNYEEKIYKNLSNGKSDFQDAKEIDDKQRYRDLK